MPSSRFVLLACAASLGVVSPTAVAAQGCATGGFLLAVEAPELTDADTAYLRQVAEALAYRWPVPSRRRDSYVGWHRVRKRTLPPEPRWADDYAPASTVHAAFRMVVPRRGKPRAFDPHQVSGDDLFDRSLKQMVTDPLPASPAIPALPSAFTGDSLVFIVHLGEIPDTVRAGGVRFAAIQRPVELQGSLEITAPRAAGTPPSSQRFATMKYDVDEHGSVVPSTIEVLDSSDRELVQAIRTALVTARYRPAEQSCRPVRITVVQTFRS